MKPATCLLTDDTWPQLTKAAESCTQKCYVAVAYFSERGSRLLPLPAGSILVVDASERAVKSGQTSPAELLKVIKRGVQVYSRENLHAKVFLLGRAAYIGSSNVSHNSAKNLVEAVVRTTHRRTTKEAKEFVISQCAVAQRLVPSRLAELSALYRPPKFAGGGGRKRIKRAPASPQLRLVQLREEKWSDRQQNVSDRARPHAAKQRKHSRGYLLDEFLWTGGCNLKLGDTVIQSVLQTNGDVFLDPPGDIVMIKRGRDEGKEFSVIFLERPDSRRRSKGALVRSLGRGSRKLLEKNGLVRNAAFASKLARAFVG